MIEIKQELENQLTNIDKMLEEIEKMPKLSKELENITIRTSNREKGFQYYRCFPGEKREYIKKSEMNQVALVVQDDYNKAVRNRLVHDKKVLKEFLAQYNPEGINDVYESLCDAKKRFVNPVFKPNNSFVEEWLNKQHGEKNSYPKENSFKTENGEYVRSKSEKILADMFKNKGIPYKYEPLLELNSREIVYPDFVLLNVRTRKTYYWEHLGYISDGDYASKNLMKLRKYEEAGYFIGDNLLLSMESAKNPLNIKEIEAKIESYLL